jgi:hypothetical protein
VNSNIKQDSIDVIKHGQLLHIIREQETRINELQSREDGYINELEKRAKLVNSLEARVIELETISNKNNLSSNEIKKYITENHSLFFDKINETKVNVNSIDQHVNSILKMAQHTVDIILEEARSRGNFDSSLEATSKSRTVHIEKLSIEHLKKEYKLNLNLSMNRDVTLDPFVVFKLTDQTAETNKISKSNFNPTWESVGIELLAIDDESNLDYNKLVVEVWDSFTMKSNELLCSGEISFTHLDLLHNRGQVVTSVDLFDSSGTLVTVAKMSIDVMITGTEHGSFSSLSSKAEYDINDQVMCNYGNEGEWVAGKVIRFKKIRDRGDTTRLYEIEFSNGDMELNVPVSRLKVSKMSSKYSTNANGASMDGDGDGAGDSKQPDEVRYCPYLN